MSMVRNVLVAASLEKSAASVMGKRPNRPGLERAWLQRRKPRPSSFESEMTVKSPFQLPSAIIKAGKNMGEALAGSANTGEFRDLQKPANAITLINDGNLTAIDQGLRVQLAGQFSVWHCDFAIARLLIDGNSDRLKGSCGRVDGMFFGSWNAGTNNPRQLISRFDRFPMTDAADFSSDAATKTFLTILINQVRRYSGISA